MNEKEEICIGAFSIQKKKRKINHYLSSFLQNFILFTYIYKFISTFSAMMMMMMCDQWPLKWDFFYICTHIFLSHISVSSDFVCMCVYVQFIKFINYVNRSVRENLLYIFFLDIEEHKTFDLTNFFLLLFSCNKSFNF